MSTQSRSTGINEEAIKLWRERLDHLRAAEAIVADAVAKFAIKKAIDEAEAKLSDLIQVGVGEHELGWEHIDLDLLREYYLQCAKSHHAYERFTVLQPDTVCQDLVNGGFGYQSSKGGFALSEDGVLFCAREESIPRAKLHVFIQFDWNVEGKSLLEDKWGSILFLHKELVQKLSFLWSRSIGDPSERDEFGGEKLIYDVPQRAVVEAFTNFLIHRDYRQDDLGRVKVFNDRVEFINPGISTVDPEKLLNSVADLEPNYTRNQRIIEAMRFAGLNQRKGSGIRWIRESLKENGNVSPDGSIGLKLWNITDEDKSRFQLTIYRRNLDELTFKKKQLPTMGLAPVGADVSPTVAADISRIIKYAPAELIGRRAETQLHNGAWAKAQNNETKRPHVLTFVALGGEGKTSLVAKWAAELAHQDWPGCDAAFAWSFYIHGTREQVAVSSDMFLKEALAFFGDEVMAGSAQGAIDKGRRLAQLVGERRTLLILDGLEPLQHAPTSPTPGELKDQGLTALLKGLAANNRGLCVVTTRYSIPDLRVFRESTAPELNLLRLSKEAGVALFRSLGVNGTQPEFETLVDEVKGHALTLNLLGAWLRDAHAGDIRKRDQVKLEEADEELGGHAFRVMDAYVRWFESEGKQGQRALAVLRLLGLFDRPADAGCLKALWKAPAIPDLTEPLIGMSETKRNVAFTRLKDAKLLTVNRDAAGTLLALDAHPLLREYFAKALREQRPEAWRAAHRRLYEHLCAATKDKPQPTLEDLQPLYQAVAHGCLAGMQQEARAKVYRDRIMRGREAYSTRKLGAYGSDLGAAACFFEQAWSRVSPALTEVDQAWLLNNAAFRLRALGRLTEALEPMRAGLGMSVKREDWGNAAISTGNLSQMELTLGEVALAVADAEQSVTYAERSGDASQRMARRTTHANALHQAGRRDEANALFRKAEVMQAEEWPENPLLFSLRGFQYCDLLLAAAERAAWRRMLNLSCVPQPSPLPESCRGVSQRAARTLQWNQALLDIALDHLTLGCAALYAVILEGNPLDQPDSCLESLQHAVDGLRRAGSQHHLPLGLLTRAWLRFLTGMRTGPESAQSDLNEAWEIAERGPMPLFMADIFLHRARLFGLSKDRPATYPWTSPQDDLAEARRLIEKHGYDRRKEELEDAEVAALGLPDTPQVR